MASCKSWQNHLGVSLFLYVVFILHKGVALDLLGELTSQSSTFYNSRLQKSFPPNLAVDGMTNTFSHTLQSGHHWWRVDLGAFYCLTNVTIVNRNGGGRRLAGAVVRAGLSSDHSQNTMIGSPVTAGQATNGAVLDFLPNPIATARYVSVELSDEFLVLAEVMVEELMDTEETGITTVNSMDFTLVANPALLGQTGDDDAIIAAYKGPHDISAGVVFGRQLPTGGSNELPTGAVEEFDPTLGCAVILRTLPESGGLQRTGVFYSEASRNGMTTRIQMIILPKDDNTIHIRPAQRTQVANFGDSVMLHMYNVHSPHMDYRWKHNGGDAVIQSWNNQLNVSIPDVSLTDEGVYSCFASGHEHRQLHGIMRLIVRGCSAEMWDQPMCLNTCRRCYNGGICHDKTGMCVCPPGFSGENCGQAHGRHIFGKDASFTCSDSTDPHNGACRGRLFCLPDPYGCSCAAGYEGLDCMQECDPRRYGADCKQTCHCAPGGTCLKDTGKCNGDCSYGYFGRNCQCSNQSKVLGLKVTSGDPHQLFVTWQPDSCFSGFTLQYELINRGQCEEIASPQRLSIADTLSGQTTNYTITGLTSQSTYTVYIQQDNEMLGPDVFTLATTQNDTSVTFLMWKHDSFSITLSWLGVLCADHYNVEYALSNRGGCEPINQTTYSQHCLCAGNTSNTTISGLIPNSIYKITIKARVDGGYGPTAEADVMTSTSEPMEPPDNVTVTAISQRSLNFSWSRPACGGRGGIITGYAYKLSEIGSFPIRIVHQNDASNAQVAILGLIPFTDYTFQVAATTSAGAGPYSMGVFARTYEAVPTVPLNVKITNVDDVSISLIWSEPVPPHGIITGYNVHYWRTGQMEAPMLDANVTQLTHRIVELKTNVTYVVRVQAMTSAGEGPWSEPINATTMIGVPGPIQNLHWMYRTENSVTLAWKEPLNPHGTIIAYIVEYRTLEKPHQPEFTAMEEYDRDEVESTIFIHNNLDPGTKYEFRVSARNQAFMGSPTVLEVYTKPLSDPPEPPQPTIYEDEATDTTVTIGLPSLIADFEFVQSFVVQVTKTATSSVTRREALIPRHYSDSADEYIAAELLKQSAQDKFVVGDSKQYGDYYNAPLQKDAIYDIRIGSVSKGNDTEAIVKFSAPRSVTVNEPNPGSSAGAVAAAVVVVIILVAVIFAIIVVYKRRKASQKNQSSAVGGVLQSADILLEKKADGFASEEAHETSSHSYIDNAAVVLCTPPPERKPKPQPKPRLKQTPAQSQPDEQQDTFKQPPPVRAEELAEYIHKKELAGEDGFQADYKTLPVVQLHPWTVAKKPENKTKNRYVNVVAYDHSRIVLEPLESDPHSDYINACYIDGYMTKDKYIASQGPNKASIRDIWRMVWQLNVDTIVMLTNPVENGKTKCVQYWADSGSTRTYSDIVVTTEKEELFLDYTIRDFVIREIGSEDRGRLVKQFHYTTWPDMKPPEYPAPLLNFMRVVNRNPTKGRTVIHCSAGVGRTGTYIALESMLEQMEKEGQVDVLGFVYSMRQKRIKMVQTAEQYKFIFDALLAASLTGDTTYNTTNFRKILTALRKIGNDSNETDLQKQFETLGKQSVSRCNEGKKSGYLPENVDKNRFPEFIPTDRARPFLMVKVHKDDTNYINATFLPGYRRKDVYIGTQMPMPNTVADIWRMVYDQKSTCVVMLNSLDTTDSTMCRYWPDEGSTEFGPLVVELLQTKEHKGVTERTFTLRNKNKECEASQTISQFQYHDWPSEQEVPSSLEGMLTLMELTQKWHHADDGPIVVHCIDGLGCTAVYCSTMALLEQYKEEKVVDVFQAAHRLRVVNASMMYSLAQYAMCYDVFQTYLESTTIYENVTS